MLVVCASHLILLEMSNRTVAQTTSALDMTFRARDVLSTSAPLFFFLNVLKGKQYLFRGIFICSVPWEPWMHQWEDDGIGARGESLVFVWEVTSLEICVSDFFFFPQGYRGDPSCHHNIPWRFVSVDLIGYLGNVSYRLCFDFHTAC